MKYSKKQRREIYLHAADMLFNRKSPAICLVLNKVTGSRFNKIIHLYYYDYLVEFLPELRLIAPQIGVYRFWFAEPSCCNKEQLNNAFNERVTACLLMAEMCND